MGQAISGLGGVGKTQTALEYGYRCRDEYQAVFWVQAETAEQLINGFVAIASRLKLPHNQTNAEEAVQATKGWLESHNQWLLILDNVDEPELVGRFLPTDIKGHILLTSRAPLLDMLGINPLNLGVLPIEEAVAFLFERTKRERNEVAAVYSASELCQEVGCLPLALEQAAAYMLAMQVSFGRYLERYRKQPLTMLEKRGPVAGGYPKSVATTWMVNIEQMGEAQRDVLRLSAFLAPDQIPLELLTIASSKLGEAIDSALEDPQLVHELLQPLHRFSLIDVDSERETYSVHRLVQEVAKSELDDHGFREWIERTHTSLIDAFPDAVHVENWTTCGRLLPHILAASRLIDKFAIHTETGLKLCELPQLYLQKKGLYLLGEPLNRKRRTIARVVFGEQHSQFALASNNLAYMCKQLGRYDEAEVLYKSAQEIWRTESGEGQYHFAVCCNNLGSLYRSTGRYEESEQLYKQALETSRRMDGDSNSLRGGTLNNLAALYYYNNRFKEAESHYTEGLEAITLAFSDGHPEVAQCMSNLAELYRVTGRHGEAELLFERALEIFRRVQHPNLAETCNNLAALYISAGRIGEADLLLREAIDVYIAALGTDHPKTQLVARNYAYFLEVLKRDRKRRRRGRKRR